MALENSITTKNGDNHVALCGLAASLKIFMSTRGIQWANAVCSEANGVVYMKCGGRTEEEEPRRRPETRPDCSRGSSRRGGRSPRGS